jgi:EAL domain-containing protein (putative c-di-GMP-specific phosphodiesterase class I)
MDAGALEELNLQSDLRQAMKRGELELLYQPKVDARYGRLSGVEALLRWNHPWRGTVRPDVFIPIAERYGMIRDLGLWVIEQACRQIRLWNELGLEVCVAVNISAQQLRHIDLARRVEETLELNGIDADRLLFEITESVAMEDFRSTQRVVEGLRRIGVFLSIDDFGTGYSSLSVLRQLPARELKIDRSFISDVATSPDARAIVDAVVRLAHALGLRVVAEGVETAAQRDMLLELGCDELQGYLFARPMKSDALKEWTRTWSIAAVSGTPDPVNDTLPVAS